MDMDMTRRYEHVKVKNVRPHHCFASVSLMYTNWCGQCGCVTTKYCHCSQVEDESIRNQDDIRLSKSCPITGLTADSSLSLSRSGHVHLYTWSDVSADLELILVTTRTVTFNNNISAVSYTHLTLPTICSV